MVQFARVLLLCTVAVSAVDVRALDPSLALTQYVQTTWRMEDGLPHNSVRSVVQTRDGYLWLGTYAGLARFDGVRFVTFDNRNSKLQHNEIRALAEDRDGTLWIGTTAGGLHRFANGALEPWDRGIEQRTINALAAVPDGTLWVGTSGGLYALRNGTAAKFAQREGLANPFVNAIARSSDSVWVATTGGLFRLHANRATQVAMKEIGSADVTSVYFDRSGTLWVGSSSRVFEFRWDAASSSLRHVRSLMLPEVWGWIHSFLEDRDRNLWIGSYGGGLYRWSGGRLDRISTEDGFVDPRPWALLEDAEGSLWLGTRGGIARLRDGAATSISVEEGLPAEIVRTVMEDHDGAMWIGTERGLTEMRNGKLRHFGQKDGLPIVAVRTLARDRDGRFWIGGDGGLAEMDTARGRIVRTIGVGDGLPWWRVRNILFDRSGRLWVGTERGLAVSDSRQGGGSWRVPAGLEDLAAEGIEALFEGRDGAIWIGTFSSGLRRWQNGKVEKPSLLEDASVGVRTFHEDADGTVYAGTIGSGLFVRTPGSSFARVTTREGLPDDAIWSILPAGEMLWMSSDRGVFFVRRTSLLDVVEGRARKLVVERLIGTQDGMKSRECNGGGQPSGLIARDGRIWVPTARGAVAIDPRKLSRNRRPPPVVIEEVVIDRRVMPHTDTLEVPPGSRDVEIHFTGLSFVDPGRVRFRYHLEGYDEVWNNTGARRAAYFSSLRPGHYELHVQASNNDGVWSPDGARLTLRVLPRLYETWWFRALIALALVAAVWAWLYLRSRRQRARVDELRRLVAERTEKLEGANAQLARLAAIDDLTGIANHRHFDATLESEWRRCQRNGDSLSLLLCDIDDFKAYNDTYGHLEGDACLRRVAQAIDGALPRRTDLAARYGGEEFTVVLPSTDAGGARAVAERILSAVRELAIEHRASRAAPYLTISIGCATVRPLPETEGGVNDLIDDADAALYAAKAEGRNRVWSSERDVSDERSPAPTASRREP